MISLENVSLKMINSNGIHMRIAEAGPVESDNTVLFLHGWPESWYSWRYQLVHLANADYHVVAPDSPGFGGTDPLPRMEDYNIITIAGYFTGLLDAIGKKPVILVGHDWGAAISWNLVKLHPEYFSKIITLSVPHRPPSEVAPMVATRQRFGDRFFYQVYFQEPGVAEAEFSANPAALLRRLYCSPDTKRDEPQITDRRAVAGGWIDRIGEPQEWPSWFSQEDLDYYVGEFSRAGFTGGINYYRNIDRNWELMAPYADRIIDIPALFMAGEKDFVIGRSTGEMLKSAMLTQVPKLKDAIVLPGIGHWIQQEASDEVNRHILEFIEDKS
jgi:pimeloyl-ACP methyl ester carboxylesterase